MDEKHIFSFYYSPNTQDNFIIDREEDLYMRIAIVLRMSEGNQYICFDSYFIYDVIIVGINKKSIINKIIQKRENNKKGKKVIAYIPYLEREYMNDIFYSMGQQGIDKIQLVKTQLSQVKEYAEKDYFRFEKLMIQGCEQGRAYHIPLLIKKIITIEEMIQKEKNLYWFYEQGVSLNKIFEEEFISQEYAFLCGPERGFSNEEVDVLKNVEHYHPIKLSHYVLRSIDVIKFASILFKSI